MSNLIEIVSWNEFLSIIDDKNLIPQFKYEDGYYVVFSKDEYILYKSILINKEEKKDFKDNYMALWNDKLQHRTSEGLIQFVASPRPDDTNTYFAGAGDDQSLGDGEEVIFNMSSSDTSKSQDIYFSEDIYIKDGLIQFQSAPLGSYFEVEIIHPVSGVVGTYCKRNWMLGDRVVYLNSENNSKIANGLGLRITIYNSDGLGDHDTACDFKVCGILEMFRASTI